MLTHVAFVAMPVVISGEFFITGVAHTNTDLMIEHIKTKTLFMGDNGLVHRHGRFE
jgi:hypothetical protein